MNHSLFEDDTAELHSAAPTAPAQPPAKPRRAQPLPGGSLPQAEPPTAQALALAQSLPPSLRLGTSSWSFPGWAGLVWDQPYAEAKLAKQGLTAYSQHPLLRTVSLDRAFYRPMRAEEYAALAAQVSDDFRFVVKVPSMISDALVRATEGERAGQGLQANPHFLDAALFDQVCLQPALQGLGAKLGALVLQMSPLPAQMFDGAGFFKHFEALAGVLSAQSAMKDVVPEAVLAVEVRNPQFLQGACRDEFAALLKASGATYCLGLHAKLPPIEEQLPILRQLWPGPLVCRWNLHSKHGQFGYQAAKDSYEPFDKLVDEDLATRAVLSKVIAGTLKGGKGVLVTINNKAEGSAPLSVAKLAQAVAERL
jgi:uncharacterized protein YecE (DUF72 family)